jgi:hypothetical protein
MKNETSAQACVVIMNVNHFHLMQTNDSLYAVQRNDMKNEVQRAAAQIGALAAGKAPQEDNERLEKHIHRVPSHRSTINLVDVKALSR